MDIEKHQQNTFILCIEIGRKLKLSNIELFDLSIAARNHDIGKSLIPKSIIYKPSALTEDEFVLMKNHSQLGADLLKEKNYKNSITYGVLHHHEKYNGTGYPGKLKGNEIPLYSRIIAVADSYDAMISDRVYKRCTMTVSEAINEILSCSGTQFDPNIVEIFLKLKKSCISRKGRL